MSLNKTINTAIYGLYDLDAVDKKIISYLRKNGREPFAKIAAEINLPSSTVRDRANRMIDSGLLKIIALVTPTKTTPRVMAQVSVKLASGDYKAIASEISKLEEVTSLIICAGRFDLLIELTCKDNAHLLQIVSQIQNMPHISHIETAIYFSIEKKSLDLSLSDL